MSELKFPASVETDEATKDRAFALYCQEHGIKDRRLGDMPLKVISEVMQAAQRLKSQETKP